MKRLLAIVMAFGILFAVAGQIQAYDVTINDPVGDQIGQAGFDTTQIRYNVNTNPFAIQILTQFTQAGIQVGAWDTLPADLILWGAESSPPAMAIPLVSHGVFQAGHLYNVTNWFTSDEIAAAKGITSPAYTWGFGGNVWAEDGTDTGLSGVVTWGAGGVNYTANGWYWTDASPAGDYLGISWATSTCNNDSVGAPVPVPPSVLLLGSGLVGMCGIVRRKKFGFGIRAA